MKAFFKRIWTEIKGNVFTLISFCASYFAITDDSDIAFVAIILAVIAVLRKEHKTLSHVALLSPIALLLIYEIPVADCDFDTYGISSGLDNIADSIWRK